MSGNPGNGLLIAGAVAALLGIAAIAVPVFTTERNKEVLKIGDLKVTARQETAHVIPPFVGPGALAIGLVLMGAAFVVRRR